MGADKLDEPNGGQPAGLSLEELFSSLESPLLHYTIRLVADREAAEDLVQEAFLKLHSQLDQVREPRRWLYRTVHNLAVNHRRANDRLIPLNTSEDNHPAPASEPLDSKPLPHEQIAHGESLGLVRLGLESLDARSREVVQLKFDQELSYKQISERTGLSVSNVGYLLHHALKTIADDLTKAGFLS